MGHTARMSRHDSRMRARRASKSARATAYAAMAGTSAKRKKTRTRAQGAGGGQHRHLVDNCGNIGCGRCYPQFTRKIVNGRPVQPNDWSLSA
jgi:hypothetical protein